MSMFEVWNNIPPGSTLHVSLDPETGFGVTGMHTIQTTNGPVLSGPIAAAHFPLEIPIGAGEQHKVEFQLLWPGSTVEVDIEAHVDEPDGSVFDDPNSKTATLSAKQKVFTVTIFANG